MNLKQQIIDDLTAAMKARDAAKTGALRMVKAAIMTREKEREQGTVLTDDETMKVLQFLVKQRRDSIEQYEKAGRTDLSRKEAEELKFIETYLPQAASAEEIERAVSAAIAETGATTPKEMGAVMKAVQAKLAGRNADGRTVS
ncbi:MAG: GatB/YqeY domain-containing protein, partial [Pyrinomonadaceae bacterium]